MWRQPVALINARVAADGGPATSLRFTSRILGLDEPPRKGDRIVDLDGAVVLPGLINAHDHLELNHYGRLKFRDRYANVTEWIDDMRPRLRHDARIRAARSHSLADRLFVGALKNLLAGVTTVAHHNPFYRELRFGCPIRVLKRYGWAHSFALERGPVGARGEAGGDVRRRYHATSRAAPFFMHLAEGVDPAAAGELDRLDRLGCLKSNVVLIHGLAIGPADWCRVVQNGTALVWCPGSNLFLFERTAPIAEFLRVRGGAVASRIALGTDSRLSGARDLLDELRIAAQTAAASPAELLAMVTNVAADLLRRADAGSLRVGAPADLVVIPHAGQGAPDALLAATRADVRLVVVAGRPLVGDLRLADVFAARGVAPRSIAVDGTPKVAAAALARRIAACAISEPGVEAA